MSLPTSIGVIPEAKAAAEPPELPPTVLLKSQGLFVVPKMRLQEAFNHFHR